MPETTNYENMTGEELVQAVLKGDAATTPLEIILASKIEELVSIIDDYDTERSIILARLENMRMQYEAMRRSIMGGASGNA